jgi:hypothetical protein
MNEPVQDRPVEERTSPSARRRSRWLKFAAVILPLIGVGVWLTWPRVDPRFVGQWDWFAAPHGKPPDSSDLQYVGVIAFQNDGSGEFESARYGTFVAHRVGIQWSVDFRGRLSFGNRRRIERSLNEELKIAIDRMLGRAALPEEGRWIVREISNERIVLEDAAKSATCMVLKRVSPAESAR